MITPRRYILSVASKRVGKKRLYGEEGRKSSIKNYTRKQNKEYEETK